MSFFSSDWDDDEEEDVFQGDVDALVRDFESKQRKTLPTLDMAGILKRFGSARKRTCTQVLHGRRQLVS